MKRNKYVDDNGEVINYGFESKKTLLNLFFIIGNVVPLILVGFIVYTVINNNSCHNMYNKIKNVSYEYLKDNDKLPENAGDSINVKMKMLYEHSYLKKTDTESKECTGTVKVTKYNDKYIYTLDVNNCGKYSVNKRYKDWTSETTVYKSGKTIIDVIPYYNVYDRQVGVTKWSNLYEQAEISKTVSEYGIRLPEEDSLPEVPEGAKIVEAQKEEITYYRYSDKSWKWYDIVGDYSDFYSEQPIGYSYKDEKTAKNTEYSEFTLNYPEEHDYRIIKSQKGYKFYYVDDNGSKVYANNGKYAVENDVDLDIYTERESESATMYSYSDKVWRWYNGQKRNYSNYKASKPNGYNYRDDELYTLGGYSSWKEISYLTDENKDYRTEEQKIMTRYRYVYEILSLKLFDRDLKKSNFEDVIGQTVDEIRENENYKLEVNYKFRYRNVK